MCLLPAAMLILLHLFSAFFLPDLLHHRNFGLLYVYLLYKTYHTCLAIPFNTWIIFAGKSKLPVAHRLALWWVGKDFISICISSQLALVTIYFTIRFFHIWNKVAECADG